MLVTIILSTSTNGSLKKSKVGEQTFFWNLSELSNFRDWSQNSIFVTSKFQANTRHFKKYCAAHWGPWTRKTGQLCFLKDWGRARRIKILWPAVTYII